VRILKFAAKLHPQKDTTRPKWWKNARKMHFPGFATKKASLRRLVCNTHL